MFSIAGRLKQGGSNPRGTKVFRAAIDPEWPRRSLNRPFHRVEDCEITIRSISSSLSSNAKNSVEISVYALCPLVSAIDICTQTEILIE